MGPMLRVIYRWKVDPDRFEEFREAWEAMTEAIRAQRLGARGSMLLRDPDRPDEVMAIATWESRAHWEEAGKQPSCHPEAGQRMKAASQFLSGTPYEVVADLTV